MTDNPFYNRVFDGAYVLVESDGQPRKIEIESEADYIAARNVLTQNKDTLFVRLHSVGGMSLRRLANTAAHLSEQYFFSQPVTFYFRDTIMAVRAGDNGKTIEDAYFAPSEKSNPPACGTGSVGEPRRGTAPWQRNDRQFIS